MTAISVIVSTYNDAKYIDSCLQSVLEQTFSDFELIIVDDASTDKTFACLTQYSDVRMHVIVHTDHLGISDARNTGLDEANGKYIAFVDGRDVIDRHYLEDLYRVACATQADIVQCGVRTFTREVPNIYKGHGMIEVISSPHKMFHHFMENPAETVLQTDKLYKSSVFNWLRYPHARMYADEAVIGEELAWCQMYVLVNEDLYFYRNDCDSVIAPALTAQRVQDRIMSMEDGRMAAAGKSDEFDQWAFARELDHFIYSYLQTHPADQRLLAFAKDKYEAQKKLLPFAQRQKYNLFFRFPAIASWYLGTQQANA